MPSVDWILILVIAHIFASSIKLFPNRIVVVEQPALFHCCHINPECAVEIYYAKSISANSSVSSNLLIEMGVTISSSQILAGTLDFIEFDLLVKIPTTNSGFNIELLISFFKVNKIQLNFFKYEN